MGMVLEKAKQNMRLCYDGQDDYSPFKLADKTSNNTEVG